MYKVEAYAPTPNKDIQQGKYFDYDEESRRAHPAIAPEGELFGVATRSTIVIILITMFVTLLSGCAMTEHRDGRGYTIRYDLTDAPAEPPKKFHRKPAVRALAKPAPETTVVIVEAERESHPILNSGKDDEIPREFAKYVSDRSLRTWRSRSQMCSKSRPGYCNAPNIPHCHGPFCHAHPDGSRRHIH